MNVVQVSTRSRLASTLRDLIEIPSTHPPGDCSAICDYIESRLRTAGVRAERLSRNPGSDNVLARFGGGSPQLAFASHVDTVDAGDPRSWVTDPHRATVIDERIYGVGASNCKAAVAVHLCLAEDLARMSAPPVGEIVLSFCSDEENLGPHGALYLKECGALKPSWLVVGGNSGNRMVLEERGVLWMRILAHGRAAHAGVPEAGDNAILRMCRLMVHLTPLLEKTLSNRSAQGMCATFNIGRISGGRNANVVPEQCQVDLDRRLLPAEHVTEAFEEIESILARSGEPEGTVSVLRLLGTKGFASSQDGRCVESLARAIASVTGKDAQFLVSAGASDGRYFAQDGIEVVGFGPGEPDQGHAANEFACIGPMEEAYEIQLRVMRDLMGIE